jgi:hypothetical protein
MVAGKRRRASRRKLYIVHKLYRPTGTTIASLVSNASSCLILLYEHLLVLIVVDPLALPNLTPSVEEVPLVLEKSLLVVRGPRFVTISR